MTPAGAGDRVAIVVGITALKSLGREIAGCVEGLGAPELAVGLDRGLLLLVGGFGFFKDASELFALQQKKKMIRQLWASTVILEL